MSHVAQVGTFVLPSWRGRGVGASLFEATRRFAVSEGYRKAVITVRGSNATALAFYRRLGFVECGRLSRQVALDGVEDDEVLLEMFFDSPR
jgi:ribosomal protein S18 acetylase RimI-like enzyme